ncbi:MAG: folate-binding protein YgfZ [Opitutales bacterium]|nr:folate-binding protein YgfZ [Opitutales bacterium]
MDAKKAFFYRQPLPALIEVTGEDAADFLHSQSSTDLRLPEGGARYGLWLDHRGRIVADAFTLRLGPERFLLVSTGCPAETIATKLEAFIIADDVSLRVVPAGTAVAFSEDAGERAGLAVPHRGQWTGEAGGSLFRDERAKGGLIWWVGEGSGEEIVVRLAAAAEPLEAPAWTARRVRLGVCEVPADAGEGETPHEAGLARFVSFNKGCFPGQEVVARMERLGRAGRCLVRVTGSGAPPGAGLSALTVGGTPAGELRSRAPDGDGWVGLALLKRKLRESAEAVTWQLENGAEVALEEEIS